MADKIWTPVKDPIKAEKEKGKEKNKGKPWKNLSSGDKDYALFLLCKEAGTIPADMLYEDK